MEKKVIFSSIFFRPIVMVFVVALAVAYSVFKGGFLFMGLVTGMAILAFGILLIARNIRVGFFMLMTISFFSVGAVRYLPGLPLGLAVDSVLVLLFIVFFLKHFKQISWTPLKNPAFFAVALWLFINVLALMNPIAPSLTAWFFAMRGVSLYLFLTLLVGFLCLTIHDDFNWFISLWFICSVIGTIWGFKQLYIGLDNAEKSWLAVPGNLTTHVLFGKLRVFSFYSDAGQFGASQAHTALVAVLLALKEKTKTRQWMYSVTALLSLIGMLISGTRGAIAIPVVGFFTYLILSKNLKVIIAGLLLFAVVFSLLKFTHVGQGIYPINRLRTALNPNDASFQVRLENQLRLKQYLKSHPFGGGIGSAGYWGQRFSPNTFLAKLALDSWYVRIAAEFGYVGLFTYLAILFAIVSQSLIGINKTTDPIIQHKMIALFCGLVGVLVASYGNQVFGQMPTGILIYLSIVFISKEPNSNETA